MLCARVAAGAGFATIEDIPDACTPSPLVANNGRCLFNYQCASGFCCPFLKSCLGDNGYEPLSAESVEADPLRKKMAWSTEYGGEADCGKDVCDICAMRECSQAMTCDMCITLNAGDGAKPMTISSAAEYGVPPYDIGDAKCGCHKDFVAAWKAGTWVAECGSKSGGAAPASSGAAPEPAPASGASPSAAPEPAPASGDSSAPAPAPPAAVADGSSQAGFAFGSLMLVAIALQVGLN